MYEELVKRLREAKEKSMCGECGLNLHTGAAKKGVLFAEAADAIEELSKPKWIKIESRPMDEEEREYYNEHYGYKLTDDEAVIFCCQLPEHGQEVLVCNRYGHVWIDTFDDDPDYGVGFETNGDMDGLVAWMPPPEPPKEESDG